LIALALLVLALLVRDLLRPVPVGVPLRRSVVRTVQALVAGEFATVLGEVRPDGEALRSPLGGTECVYWELSTGRSGHCRFHLVDATGSVPVRLDAARVLLRDRGAVIRAGERPGELESEGCLPVGERITVIGDVERDPTSALVLRAAMVMVGVVADDAGSIP
jgi:hypothetical protein